MLLLSGVLTRHCGVAVPTLQSDGFHTTGGGNFAPDEITKLGVTVKVLGSFKRDRHSAIRELILEGLTVGTYIQPSEFSVLYKMP